MNALVLEQLLQSVFTTAYFKLLTNSVITRAGEPERPEPHDLVGAGAILFFLQESEHFIKLEWCQSWSRSWHKLVGSKLQQFLKIL